jgi:hypothetical protein
MTDTTILPKELERIAESMALGEVFTDWDGEMSFADILDVINAKPDEWVTDTRLTVWAPFEYTSGSDLDDQLESLKRAFLRAMTIGYTAVGSNALDGTETDVLGDLLFYTIRNADELEDRNLYRSISNKLFNTNLTEGD